MRTLVLGGTAFVGRAIVEELLDRGDEVTVFGRGQTGTELFPDAERRRGDRSTGDYTALTTGSWDAVVDVSAYVPRHVREAADALGNRVGRSLFISTGSVYDLDKAGELLTEDAERVAPERGTEQITGATYGRLKVACEDDLLARYGQHATIVRPGIVAGPHDPTDRFTLWARRAARGGRVALPGDPDQPVQVVDSRDLARLVVQLLVDDRPGTWNAVGPARPVTLRTLVEACAAGAGSTVEVVPVTPAEAPLVLTDRSAWPLFQRDASRARTVGLTSTPLETTAADVLAWDRARGLPPIAGELSPEQEDALLAG